MAAAARNVRLVMVFWLPAVAVDVDVGGGRFGVAVCRRWRL